MIPRTITFDEIQQGDRLRVEIADVAREGVVARQSANIFWQTARGLNIACRSADTITLLDRPTPLPREQGAPIMIYCYRSVIDGRRADVEIVAVRSGSRFRDMGGLHYEDHEILAWAPLVAGERVER